MKTEKIAEKLEDMKSFSGYILKREELTELIEELKNE